MAFGFPARFTESRTFWLAPDELSSVIKSAFETLGWLDYEIRQEGEFYRRLHTSPFTWGEELRVKILSGGTIEVESKCCSGGWRGMPQIFDFGANRRNVETFFAQVEHGINRGSDQKPVFAMQDESRAQGQPVAHQNRWVGSLLGCCMTLLMLGVCIYFLIYFISAVIGLLTGQLYFLPARGAPGVTIHGPRARIISGIILSAFAWLFIRIMRKGRGS